MKINKKPYITKKRKARYVVDSRSHPLPNYEPSDLTVSIRYLITLTSVFKGIIFSINQYLATSPLKSVTSKFCLVKGLLI